VGALIALIVLGVIALLWVWPAIKANEIGRRKDRENAWLWGFALGWIGVLVLSAAPTPTPVVIAPTPTRASPSTKTCPRCAETVKSAARVCRFCGHEFEPL
jgi:hypothetical protein